MKAEVMQNQNETFRVPVVTLSDDDLDALELLLGGLVNDEHSYPISDTWTSIEWPVDPGQSKVGEVFLADRDRTPLARTHLTAVAETPLKSEYRLTGNVSRMAQTEHGPFREHRIATPIPGSNIVILDASPTPTMLEHIRSVSVGLEPAIRLVMVTTTSEFRNPDFVSILAELEAASRLLGALVPGILVVPPGIDPALPLTRTQAKILLDLRSAGSRLQANGGKVILLSGLSGSGKSTVGRELLDQVRRVGRHRAVLLDGDDIRQFLSKGLGFSKEDRETNIERIGWVAARISEAGGVAICTPIAPFEATREKLRSLAGEVGEFLMVHISTPLEICEQRDRKGLYTQARAGLIEDFTGISSPYEAPLNPDLIIDTSLVSVDTAARIIIERLYPSGTDGS